MCPPGYHHNGFVATHALGHMIYIYIYIYGRFIYIYIYGTWVKFSRFAPVVMLCNYQSQKKSNTRIHNTLKRLPCLMDK